MTEDEANTKWCPFALVRGFASDGSVNRPFGKDPGDVTDEECRCLGSACMAWRSTPRRGVTTGYRSPSGQWIDTPGGIRSSDGRCGLAGE